MSRAPWRHDRTGCWRDGSIRWLDRCSQIFESNTPAFPKRHARFGDPAQELRVVFEPVLKPIVLRIKPDQDARWAPMASNDDLFFRRQA